MPVERVKITSSNITLKNSGDSVIFNTDFNYLKTDSNATFGLSNLSATIYPYRTIGYKGTATPSVTVTKDTGLTIDYIIGSDYTGSVDRYCPYVFPTNGNLIIGNSQIVIGVGNQSALLTMGTTFVASGYWELYANTRLLCVVKLLSGVRRLPPPQNTIVGTSYFPYAVPTQASTSTTNIIKSVAVNKGEQLRIYRPSAISIPGTVSTTANMRLQFNSGTTNLPLRVA